MVDADMNNAAVVTAFSPAGSSSTAGGETVVITGTGFTGVNGVGFGSYGAQFTVVSDTEIHATAPTWDGTSRGANSDSKISVWKGSLGSDGSQLAAWTWGGQTETELDAAH